MIAFSTNKYIHNTQVKHLHRSYIYIYIKTFFSCTNWIKFNAEPNWSHSWYSQNWPEQRLTNCHVITHSFLNLISKQLIAFWIWSVSSLPVLGNFSHNFHLSSFALHFLSVFACFCYCTHDKPKFLFSSHQCLLHSNLALAMENVWNEIEKTQLKLLGNVKLTQKAKLLTMFCQLLQPFSIC